jgi:hypothetical protein
MEAPHSERQARPDHEYGRCNLDADCDRTGSETIMGELQSYDAGHQHGKGNCRNTFPVHKGDFDDSGTGLNS